jgi:hypothetical protein
MWINNNLQADHLESLMRKVLAGNNMHAYEKGGLRVGKLSRNKVVTLFYAITLIISMNHILEAVFYVKIKF